MAVSLVLPLQSIRSLDIASSVEDLSAPPPALGAVSFPDPIDTTLSVPEYPLVSRALMLDGGSTDAVLDDFDGDGVDDLAVAVSEANLLSVFFGQPDGTFLSWPDVDVTLAGIPIALGVVDRYENGNKEIVVLQRKSILYEFDHFVRINTTTWISSSLLTVAEGAMDLAIGDLSGTSSPDIAVISEGVDPLVDSGSFEVFRGPNYADSIQVVTGLGTYSIASGDYDNSGTLDVAVSNRYEGSVDVYLSPLTFGMPPTLVLDTDGAPYGLASGNFNGDSLTDLAVACQEPSSLELFLQAESTGLPATPSPQVSLSMSPSKVVQGDMDSDSKADLLVLSESECRVLGFYQGISPLWPSTPSFSFPSGSVPRSALVGDLTGDGLPDIGVTSARDDWSGSSMAVYPSRDGFSNSNYTVWTTTSGPASSMATGDLDGDSREDIVLAIPSQNAFGYMLGYSGSTNVAFLGYAPEDMIVIDVDGDGLSDVVTANRTSDYAWVHFGKPGLPSDSMTPVKLNCSGNVTDISTG
ncbi:MAG: hypothetical protein QG582_154, partial [Candidatus Thermoplasmatota archaeon]|nr:hypothetical protein [Candidatus Thermoplasmatota archaeon]